MRTSGARGFVRILSIAAFRRLRSDSRSARSAAAISTPGGGTGRTGVPGAWAWMTAAIKSKQANLYMVWLLYRWIRRTGARWILNPRLKKEMVPSDLIPSLAHHRHARY